MCRKHQDNKKSKSKVTAKCMSLNSRGIWLFVEIIIKTLKNGRNTAIL